MLMLIFALLIKLRVNFRDVKLPSFPPQICDTLQTFLTQPNNKFYFRPIYFTSIFDIGKSFPELQLNFLHVRCQLYSVKIRSCPQQILLFFFWSRRRVNSLILKSYPLCRPNLLYWEANLPSICVNLSLGKYAIMSTSVYFL